jgi:RND superfamily putative drug exporter
MQRRSSHRWSRWILRHGGWVLLTWMLCTIAIRIASPGWDQVAYDGDFEYLPAEMSSVAGGRLLDEAFPGERSRSQIVLVLAREDGKFSKRDSIVGLDLLRRLYHRLAEVSWQRALEYGYEGGPPVDGTPWARWIQLARDALDQSIAADEVFYDLLGDQVPDDAPNLFEPRVAIAYWDRGKLREAWGEPEEAVGEDFEAALIFMPDLPTMAVPIADRPLKPWQSLLDVLSWEDKLIGAKMQTDRARLAILQLSSELAATGNIQTVEAVHQLIDEVLSYSSRFTDPGLELLSTGSAAVGGETLMAARDAIRYTEWITVAMILLILAAVYRAPLLVLIPMISIGVAVVVSTSLVALLANWSMDGSLPWLDIRVFTTSRIFIVVILFGAGTDYCLFLISRLREEATKAPWPVACERALSNVMGALLGSALTTVVGLAMLWIADFGKFHYTGPIVAICLLVGLFVCTSLTPVLLRLVGPRVFWPTKIHCVGNQPPSLLLSDRNDGGSLGGGAWNWIALMLTRRPVSTLGIGFLLLLIPAVVGLRHEDAVTYDLSSELSHSASSRRGLRLLQKHFDIGQINPVTVLLLQQDETPRKEFEKQIHSLAEKIYTVPGVATVRTADDPLGDFPPDRDMSLLSSDAWKRRALRNHRVAQQYFFSSRPEYQNRLARLDVTIDGDPFSIETAAVVSNVAHFLHGHTDGEESQWKNASVLLTGTTPSIIDLRSVTLRDNRRIKIAVVVAVLAVLIVVIRRFWLSVYLIVTVLISYYATLGLTLLFFERAYGDDFVGLDWKLPLFLFVILVAVGQDYNVYLVTRIIEEQRKLGWLIAIRRAVARTGGIITACGLVMAATFFSMTSSAWFPPIAVALGLSQTADGPALRGIIELGFALGLGVLIDTFYVRTILVPSAVTIFGRLASRTGTKRPAS